MHGAFTSSPSGATFGDDKSVVDSCRTGQSRLPQSFDDKSVSSLLNADEDWFATLARSLLGPKSGTQLHYITGVDERSCQRYASGAVKIPGAFLRALLRSEQGAPFFAALMDGSDAAWWRELQRAQRIADQIDKLDLT